MSFLDLNEIPAISFRYGGASSQDFLPGWQRRLTTEKTPEGSLTHVIYTEAGNALEVAIHIRRFEDFPALDWVVELQNKGLADTPLLENILPLDLSIPIPPRERLQLHHARGSSCQMDDFLPRTTELMPGSQVTLSPEGGRSSNGTLPFMNLQRDGSGLVLGIGWSGQWAIHLERTPEALHLAAGMERTHLRLQPGEKIRTPRILALQWEGGQESQGSNRLRQLLLKHYLPRREGQPVMPPVAQCLQSYFYSTGQAGEQFERIALPKTAALGAEAYWIDACWYGGMGEWWQEVGSWAVNRARFPHGLRPISDAARQAGMQFVLLFEPERIRPNSRLHQEHPEYLLASSKDPSNLLLNLGMAEARKYITDLISELIDECGVDIYRQDFNFDPLPYWQAADPPERIGITEIRYVTGFYAFWDELLHRHPQLWIDNCASGGRRIDLETLSRSLPLWPSDFCDTIGLSSGLGLHVGAQCINAGLARWVPLFGGGVWNFTPYSVRSQIIGGFTFGMQIENQDLPSDETRLIVPPNDILARGKTLLDDDFPLAEAQAAIAEWKSIRPFFLGDFYLLLPLTVSYHDWCGWQSHRQDLQAGIAMFFRRHRSPFPIMEVALHDLDPEAEYQVSLSTGFQEAPRRRMSGQELAHLTLAIAEAPGSLLLRYQRV